MLRGLVTWCILTLLTILLGIPAMIISALRSESDVTMRAGRVWSRAMLAVTGARVSYCGLQHLESDEPRIFISNHLSLVDIWALIQVLPLPTRFVAKQELRRVPVVGSAMAVSGFVFIDRSNRERAIGSLRIAAEKVRGGRSVVLFAEGTRSKTGRLQPFKKGPFHLALEAGVPIVPVAISGSWDVIRPGSIRVESGPVQVRFLEPLDVSPFRPDDVGGLLAAVHELLRRQLEPADATAS